MTWTFTPRLASVLAVASGFVLASAVSARQSPPAEKIAFDPAVSVMKFSDPYCMDDDGKVAGKVLASGKVTDQKKGCLTVQADGKTYYVMKPAPKGPCVKRATAGPKATVTAGSAGAGEC